MSVRNDVATMAASAGATEAEIARLLSECLRDGVSVEIDGLGVFFPGPDGRFRFTASDRPRVFLAYVDEDLPAVVRLFHALSSQGFDPWLDKRKLLPGQNWPRAIEEAIRVSDFFLPCLSRRAILKRGHFHAELRYALDCASRMPLDAIYIVPVRLEECPMPARIAEHIQYVDLFPDWERGLRRLLGALDRHRRDRNTG